MTWRAEMPARLKHPLALLPREPRALLRTLVGVALLVPGLLLASACVGVLALVGAPRRWIDPFYTGFARLCARVGGTRILARGLEHIDPGQAYVVVANHESDWDPVVIFATLRMLPMRVIVKRQIARIPVFGAALLASGNVRVDRDDAEGDVGRIEAGMRERAPDVSILFYAEGTRSRDGSLRPFKKGAFTTAIRYGMPILPVGTAGTYRIWPPLTLQLRTGPAALEVGAPIPTDGLTHEDREALRARCHAAVGALRTRARTRLRERGVEPGGVD